MGSAVLLAAIAVLCLPVASGDANAAGQGLNLGEAEEKVLEALDRPNPHFSLPCSECHAESPVLGRDTAETVKFVNGEAGNVDLCLRCHDAADNLHPVNMDPRSASPPLQVPDFLPLERRGASRGAVVCSTCHFIHARTAGLRLLRGFPESSDPADAARARFRDRRDLCRSCHGAGLEAKTPHKGKIGLTRTCSFCHSVTPRVGEKVELTQGLVQVCDFCHGATKGAHYLLVNPFADPSLREEVARSGLPTQNGEYTCISCHNPHGGTGEPKYLRAGFVELALKSARVRPHYLASFCRACHEATPRAPRGAPGAPALAEIPLRDGDPNALCNRCHASGLSKANAHPLRKVSEKYRERIPEGWPLHEGGLSCLTCHSAGDSPFYDPLNPSFLRGGPYETRNDICWKCHLHEELAQLNPHQDINSGQGCEFCHDTRPDVKKSLDVRQFRFKGDIVMLCLRCHQDAEHPASRSHNGVPDEERMARINIAIPAEFPLDGEGRVHCATCHDPHVGAQGAIRGFSVGTEICPQCHRW